LSKDSTQKVKNYFNIVKSFCPKSQKLVLLANYFWGKTKKFEKIFFNVEIKKKKKGKNQPCLFYALIFTL
jgi:hypothetical protein